MFIGGRGDWTAVRLAALLRAARLSAHRGEEAHQQLQQGACPRLLGLKVPMSNSALETSVADPG
jgi:hypothetical protein